MKNRSFQFEKRSQLYEAPGVEPVFLDQDQAIDYAVGRACFRSGEIRVMTFGQRR